MALSTKSKFYYGWEVTSSNRYIDFYDGTDTLQAVLTLGTYTSQELADEVALQLNTLAGIAFTVSFNRSNRRFTIASGSNFNLLFATGNQAGNSAASLLGYASSDLTAAMTYTSSSNTGFEYSPQFYLQSYKPTSNNRKAIDAVVNKSASGVIEVVKFGNERFMSCEILFITNNRQDAGSIIETDVDAVESYISFIEWATDKGKLEFMPDRSDVTTYQDFILESTDANSDGLDYELIELYDRSLPEYYRSGMLRFRLLE
jgi:hypothetical protein